MPMKYFVSQIETWREELAALPPPDPGRRKVGKEQAVIMLSKELRAAARQGYTARELLDVLAAKGLKVHADTLRDALRKVRRGAKTTPQRGRGQLGDASGALAGEKPAVVRESAEVSPGGSKGEGVGEGEAAAAEGDRKPGGGRPDIVTDSPRSEEAAAGGEPSEDGVGSNRRTDRAGAVTAARPEGNDVGASEAVNAEGVRAMAGGAVAAATEPAWDKAPGGQAPAAAAVREIADGPRRSDARGTGGMGVASQHTARLTPAPPAPAHDHEIATERGRTPDSGDPGAPNERELAVGNAAATRRTLAPPGRATFTPRSDSEDI